MSPFSLCLSFLICDMDSFFSRPLTPSCLRLGLGGGVNDSFFHATNNIWATSIGCECCGYTAADKTGKTLCLLCGDNAVCVWSGETKYETCQLVISTGETVEQGRVKEGLGWWCHGDSVLRRAIRGLRREGAVWEQTEPVGEGVIPAP